MNKSEEIGNLAKALCAVQSALRPAIKDAANPFFKSKYADLNSVWDSCRGLLSENGLSVTQLNDVSETGVIVETVLMHESGEWISGKMYLPLAKHDPQGVGSAVTYGRRYGLSAIIGIVSDEDDDGNAASQQRQPKPQREAAPDKPLADRINNAIQAIRGLGGQAESVNTAKMTDAEMKEELKALTDQYNRLKASKA